MAIESERGSVLITNSIFSSVTSSNNGGAIYVFDDILNEDEIVLIIKNSTFLQLQATKSGGVAYA